MAQKNINKETEGARPKGTLQRIINFRPMFVGAVLLCLAILCSVLVLFDIRFLILACIIYAAVVVLCIVAKQFRRLIALSIIYFLGFAVTLISISFYSDSSLGDTEYVITGRVNEISESYGGSAIMLGDVRLIDEHSGTKKLSGSTRFMAYGGLDVKLGDKVVFSGKVSYVEMSAFRLLKRSAGFDYSNDIRYTAGVSGASVTVVDGSMHLDEIIKNATKERLLQTMGATTGGIAYAILFGDRSVVDDNIYQSFKESGTVHLLAVSGMHVVIVIGIIYFFLSLFKMNKWVRFGIMAAVILGYCYMCGFIPSVVRSGIMALVLMIAPLLGRKNDALSSIGIACILILLFKPLYLFDVGFQLSFMAVLGIIFCSMLLKHLSIKNKFLKSVMDISIITIFTSFVTLPIITGYFGVFPLYTIIANIAIIPIFTLAHIFLCVFCLIAVPLEFMSFLLVVPQALFEVIFWLNSLLVSLPLALIKTVGFGLLGSIIFFMLAFMTSRFVMLKAKIKALCCCALTAFCVIMVVINNIPAYAKTPTLEFHNQATAGFAMLVASGGEYYIVDPDVRSLREVGYNLKDVKVSRLNGIIFSSNNNFEPNRMTDFVQKFGNPTIFVDSDNAALNNLVLSGFKVQVIDNTNQRFGNIEYRNFKLNSTVLALELKTSGSTIVVVNKNLSSSQTNTLISVLSFDIDYLYFLGLGANAPPIGAENILSDIDKKKVCVI
ncbi:MAG: ComEC/Rec2 family competence protein [Christensenellaceae bacterium]|jgi:ComEC/Rec2-related protein|nr:ComEC/Rec2 family competence protein [Christensenellaceae bacterium]